jgi:hypothetical protein
MAVGAPILAEEGQGVIRHRHVAILTAFALSHMQQVARAINLTDLQLNAFLEAQATGVNGRQADPIVRAVEATQNLVHFADTQDDR